MSYSAVWAPPSAIGPASGGKRRRRRGTALSSFRACASADDGGGGGLPRMVLHDSLDAAGVSTEHARAAQEGFARQGFRRANAASDGRALYLHLLRSAIEMSAAKAAQHRLMRGVWTNVRFGDMRRALAACERLILLNPHPRELRDYAALLYHCGYYKDCLQYITAYQTAMAGPPPSNPLEALEDDAVNTLRARVSLILAEDGWNSRRPAASYWTKNSEPW